MPQRDTVVAFLSNKHQCLALLQACSSMADLRRIHARIHTLGLSHDKFLTSETLRFCSLSTSGSLPYAFTLLRHSPDPSIASSWNHLIRAYSHTTSPRHSITLYAEMRGVATPNELTFPFVLKACARLSALRLGRQVHADAIKCSVDSVVYVQNTLIHLYDSCHQFGDAMQMFDYMPLRTVVSWNSILTACVENSRPEESIGLFCGMRVSGLAPDQTTFVILLSASAELGSLRLGRLVHNQIIRQELHINLQLGTALVNMYAKCGELGIARSVFERMSERNVWTWSAVILGYAQHGLAVRAFELFSGMKSASVEPNYVTFLGVMCACSHAGLVDDGYRFFDEMVHVHGIEPRMSHYSAMVDVLGRNGRLREALEFIKCMHVEPDAVVWRTLLSACSVRDAKCSTEIGEIARKKLLLLEPRRSGNYVIVANMYSEEGSWEKAANVRRMMREEGLKKAAGESCIEVSGSVYRFVSGDDSCANWDNISNLLDGLNLNMKIVSCIDINSITGSIQIF